MPWRKSLCFISSHTLLLHWSAFPWLEGSSTRGMCLDPPLCQSKFIWNDLSLYLLPNHYSAEQAAPSGLIYFLLQNHKIWQKSVLEKLSKSRVVLMCQIITSHDRNSFWPSTQKWRELLWSSGVTWWSWRIRSYTMYVKAFLMKIMWSYFPRCYPHCSSYHFRLEWMTHFQSQSYSSIFFQSHYARLIFLQESFAFCLQLSLLLLPAWQSSYSFILVCSFLSLQS